MCKLHPVFCGYLSADLNTQNACCARWCKKTSDLGLTLQVMASGVRGTAWYSLATRGLVIGGGVGGGVGRMLHCNSYSDS